MAKFAFILIGIAGLFCAKLASESVHEGAQEGDSIGVMQSLLSLVSQNPTDSDALSEASGGSSNGSGLVLMKFGAPWCGPCRMIDEELDDLKTRARVVKVNVDQSRTLASEYGVSSIPHLFLVRHGKVIDDRTGFATAGQLEAWIREHAGEPTPGMIRGNPFVQ